MNKTVIDNTKRSWWKRNRKWALPLIIIFIFVIAVLIAVTWFMRSSDAFKIGMATAQGNSDVVSILGEPIKAGWIVRGTLEISGSNGKADMAIPISGPKGSGTLYVQGTKEFDVWSYNSILFRPDSDNKLIRLK